MDKQFAIYSKTYKFTCKTTNNSFKFFISCYDNGTFYGEIWFGLSDKITYPKLNMERANSAIGMKEFNGATEKDIYDSIENWFKQNISQHYEIELTEHIKHK